MAIKLSIGVMLEAVQLSDIMGIDIFSNISTEYVDMIVSILPEYSVYQANSIEITWYYISSSLEPAPLTLKGLGCMPNITYNDCPRDLDIVITGGPPPQHRPVDADRFIKEAWETTRVWMAICTGSPWLASSGVLNGMKCTTNRGFLPAAKQLYPEVKWLDQRWVMEEKPYLGTNGKGELWTSGGALAGTRFLKEIIYDNALIYDQAWI
jgi:transcriptional regulator GlxA family with amidase domain